MDVSDQDHVGRLMGRSSCRIQNVLDFHVTTVDRARMQQKKKSSEFINRKEKHHKNQSDNVVP